MALSRDEAKESARNIDFIARFQEYENLIDEIYDYFDIDIKLAQKIIENEANKKCKNCLYAHMPTRYASDVWCSHYILDGINVHRDFGCNLFEENK